MGSEAGGSDGALVVGLEVDVRSLDDSKRTQRAKIVRVHRTGDVTVQYEESGDSEKNVSADRVKVVAGGEGKSKFSVGDRVAYLASDSKKGDEDWREGTVKLSRPDGTLDVVDTESNEVVRKLPASSVRSPRGKKDTTKAAKNPRQDSDISEEGAKKLAVDAAVEVKDKRGAWQPAHVLKARSDGTYDLALDNDSDDVMRKVDRQSIRSIKAKESPSRKQMKNKAEEDEEDEDDERQAIRKRKSSSRRSRKKEGSDEEEDEDEDEDASDARAVRPGATRVKSSQARSLGILQINSRVYYRGKDGLEYKGIVLKVWRDGGKRGEPAYDVEDLMDGTMFTKMTASKVRAMPWLDVSLPRWNGLPNVPNVFSFLNGPVLRKGVRVRFRKRDEESERIVWTEGVIVKAKPDDSCIIDFLDQDGKKERATVKNRDIQARFFSPFSGMFDGMLDGLSLPTIDLPRTSFKVGSAVEVSNGSKVHLGTVLSYNDSAKTYSIQYSDGSKAKNVPSDTVRLSLRRLRIGTEVEMIVEGPCKEVSKLDGEVAWVHRNEKVAVRINGGNNDVFAEVCPHALMVDGQPAFSAPLSSTWLELIGYYLNLATEMFIYAWFCFGMLVELGEMTQLRDDLEPELLQDPSHMAALFASENTDWSKCRHSTSDYLDSTTNTNSTYLLIPSDAIDSDRSWLLTLLIVKAILTAICVILAARRVHSKVAAIQDDFIDVKEFQQDQVIRRRLGIVMGLTIIVSFTTLINYASLLNRFEYFCLFDRTAAPFQLDRLALNINVFAIHTSYASTLDLLVALTAKTVFNLFRAVAFFFLIFAFPTSNTDFIRRVLWLLPAIVMTALVCAIAISSLHIFYYVQRLEILQDGLLSLSTDTDLTIVGVLVALWFSQSIYRLIAAGGRYVELQMVRQWTSRGEVDEDVLDQAERGEFGLQAKKEALITKVEQRQTQLGVFKLSMLRVHSAWLVHLTAMIVGIAIDVRLRQTINSYDMTGESIVLSSLSCHLGICCAWLALTTLAAMYAVVLRRESPELLALILTV